MVDIYFIQSILNIIWYIFSILFVLYKFTSFFSYIWNFIRFLGKFTKGITYLIEQFKIFVTKRKGQQSELPRYNNEINPLINRAIDVKEDPVLLGRPPSYTKKTFVHKINELIFGKKNDNYIPLEDTRLSYINSNLMDAEQLNTRTNYNSEITFSNSQDLDKTLFDKHIETAMQSNYSDMSDIDGFKNIKINHPMSSNSMSSTIYPPPQKRGNNINAEDSNLESYLDSNANQINIQNQNHRHNNILSSLLTSELTDNPFSEDIKLSDKNDNSEDKDNFNPKNNFNNSNINDNKELNSNIFFESTFIKKWLK